MTLFDEAGSSKLWNYAPDGTSVGDFEFLPDLARLSGSVNGAMSSGAEVVVVARQEHPPQGVMIWIGIYSYVKGRNNKGNRGAGLWLLNGRMPGTTVLGFLEALAESWAAKELGSRREAQAWEAFDPGRVLLREFVEKASDGHPVDPIAPSSPEIDGLIDLASADPRDFALWLDRVQSNPDCFRYKRVYVSSDAAVCGAIRSSGAIVLYPQAPTTERDGMSPSNAPSRPVAGPAGPRAKDEAWTLETIASVQEIDRRNYLADRKRDSDRFGRIEDKLQRLTTRIVWGCGAIAIGVVAILLVWLIWSLVMQPEERSADAAGMGGKQAAGKQSDAPPAVAAAPVRSDALLAEFLARVQEALDARDKVRQVQDLLAAKPRLDPIALEKRLREVFEPIPLPPPVAPGQGAAPARK